MEVGCYTLNLYCDRKPCAVSDRYDLDKMWEYTDEIGSVCRTAARKDGWIFHKNNTVSCPYCNGLKIPINKYSYSLEDSQ